MTRDTLPGSMSGNRRSVNALSVGEAVRTLDITMDRVPHSIRHATPVDGCFACKIRSINIAPSATPSRRGGSEAATNKATEQRWEQDHPAYRRLRANGLQPRSLDGAAELESRAVDRFEIEMGHLVPKEQHAEVREGLALAQELRDAS